MPKIVIDINDCRDCPHVECERTVGAGWAFDYSCVIEIDGKPLNRKIMGYVEYTSDVKPVPKWCPIMIKPKCGRCGGRGYFVAPDDFHEKCEQCGGSGIQPECEGE